MGAVRCARSQNVPGWLGHAAPVTNTPASALAARQLPAWNACDVPMVGVDQMREVDALMVGCVGVGLAPDDGDRRPESGRPALTRFWS